LDLKEGCVCFLVDTSSGTRYPRSFVFCYHKIMNCQGSH
jgi:hypothetical protein